MGETQSYGARSDLETRFAWTLDSEVRNLTWTWPERLCLPNTISQVFFVDDLNQLGWKVVVQKEPRAKEIVDSAHTVHEVYISARGRANKASARTTMDNIGQAHQRPGDEAIQVPAVAVEDVIANREEEGDNKYMEDDDADYADFDNDVEDAADEEQDYNDDDLHLEREDLA